MPKREPRPYYKKSHACWYVNIQGRPIRLDPDEAKAQHKYHRVMSGRVVVNQDALVLEVIAAFLAYTKRENSPRTQQWYKEHLESFYKHVSQALPRAAVDLDAIPEQRHDGR